MRLHPRTLTQVLAVALACLSAGLAFRLPRLLDRATPAPSVAPVRSATPMPKSTPIVIQDAPFTYNTDAEIHSQPASSQLRVSVPRRRRARNINRAAPLPQVTQILPALGMAEPPREDLTIEEKEAWVVQQVRIIPNLRELSSMKQKVEEMRADLVNDRDAAIDRLDTDAFGKISETISFFDLVLMEIESRKNELIFAR